MPYKPKSFETWTKERQEEWRQKQTEKKRKWRRANPEKAKELDRKWRRANPEKAKERCLKWRRANPEKAKELDRKYGAKTRQQKAAIKFFQMTQAVAEIATIDTTKLNEKDNRKHIGASI